MYYSAVYDPRHMEDHMYLRITAILIGIFVFSMGVAAQDWAAVEGLKPGTRVYIVEKNGRDVKGKIVSVSGASLELFSDSRRIQIVRDEISTIHLTRRGSLWRRALIGAAAGAGIGVAVGVAVTVVTKSDGLAAAGGFLYGIPVGAAVGAATTKQKRGDA